MKASRINIAWQPCFYIATSNACCPGDSDRLCIEDMSGIVCDCDAQCLNKMFFSNKGALLKLSYLGKLACSSVNIAFCISRRFN